MNSFTDSSDGIYYFLGNITSHVLHALPLHKELGGTFVVSSEKAKREVERYNVPVINIDNNPRKWVRFGYKIKPIYHYLEIGREHKKTVDYLNKNAKVVIFYELYNFDASTRITEPKTVFLTHGNMLKDYMGSSNRLEILEQYDYMAALGPHLKREFTDKNGIRSEKLADIGIARTDDIVKNQGNVTIAQEALDELGIDPTKKIISYMPTFWGASSIYTTGKDIIRYFPDNYTLLFRPHPQTPKKLLDEYMLLIDQKPGNVLYAPEGRFTHLTLLDTFAASTAIIGDISSVTLEAILTNKPLLFAYDTQDHTQSERDYIAIKDVVNYSQAITPQTREALPEIIEKALDRGIDKRLWKQTQDYTFFHNDGTSVRSISNFIKSLI